MKILFTNQNLERLGGQQVVLRDLAAGLQKLGHTVLAYSDLEPPPEDSLADDSVPITSCLKSLPFVPDVIHAQHHLSTMTAIMALPGVPAVYCCGGATPMDKQPKHPRIFRYVAMSPTLGLRMAIESGIDESLIDVVYNAVDLNRFRAIRSPPDRPRRALVYKRSLDPDSLIGREIREAAVVAGLELDFRGIGPKLTRLANPEEVLPEYDLVFTSGKSAIDALACGCAVILLGNTGHGEMVCEANFDRLRRSNFSPPVNSPPPSAATILGQIDRYSAAKVAASSQLLRQVAGLDGYVDQFLAIYERAIDAHRQAAPNLRDEQRAAVRYLRSLAPLIKPLDGLLADRINSPTVDALREGISRQLDAMSSTEP
jgi:hypothetical protein